MPAQAKRLTPPLVVPAQPTQRSSVRLTNALWEQLSKLADDNGLKRDQVISQLLVRALDNT